MALTATPRADATHVPPTLRATTAGLSPTHTIRSPTLGGAHALTPRAASLLPPAPTCVARCSYVRIKGGPRMKATHRPSFDASGEAGGRPGRCRSSVNQLGLCWREPCHQFNGGHLKVRKAVRGWKGVTAGEEGRRGSRLEGAPLEKRAGRCTPTGLRGGPVAGARRLVREADVVSLAVRQLTTLLSVARFCLGAVPARCCRFPALPPMAVALPGRAPSRFVPPPARNTE